MLPARRACLLDADADLAARRMHCCSIATQGAPHASQARELRARLGPGVKLIMNDRADLCLAAGSMGCMLGRMIFLPSRRGASLDRTRWLGVSTHNPEQLAEADRTSADYLAIGPVFATASKANPDPVVGLEGVRRARELTRKPLVAIGGITRATPVP
jgi:thiamine-phosphate pyrophosphorylase